MLDDIPLEIFVGPCILLDFSNEQGEAVSMEMLKNENIKKGDRVLLKTRNSTRGLKDFYDDYVYLDGDAAEYLVGLGVSLVGIDALSIKKRGGSDHRPHTALLSKNIPIIEGLDFSKVDSGEYELICLPLNFTGIDGAPARAILIQK
jgi:arylformamidase